MSFGTKVVLFALVKENKILLEKRFVKGYKKPQYLIPGGAINVDSENLEQALIREMKEELGAIPKEFKLLTEDDIPGLNENILKPFIVTSWDGEIPKFILDSDDPFPLEWMELNTAFKKIPVKPTKKIVEVLKQHLKL